MGAHKGKRYKDRATKQRYWSEGHLLLNKLRRIRKNSGQFADREVAKYQTAHKPPPNTVGK